MSEEAKKPAVRPKPAAKKPEAKPLPPSPKQPFVDQLASELQAKFGDVAIENAFINQSNDHLPTIIISREKWPIIAQYAKEELGYSYVQNMSAVDYEDYLEIVCHLKAKNRKERLAIKVKVDREHPELSTVSHIWAAANWNEREIYDLMGISFTGHPNLKRILMPDDWEGYPLRKDYEPLDKEV